MKKQIITIALLISSLIGYSNTEIKNYLVDISKKVTVEFKNVKKGHLLSIKDNQLKYIQRKFLKTDICQKFLM